MTAYTYRDSATDTGTDLPGMPIFETQNLVSLLSTQLNLDLAPLLPTTPVDNMITQDTRLVPVSAMLAQAFKMLQDARTAEQPSLAHHEGFLADTGFSEDVLSQAINRRDETRDDKAWVSFDTPVASSPVPVAVGVTPTPPDFTILAHEVMSFMSFLAFGQGTTYVLVPLNEAQDATDDPTTGQIIVSAPESVLALATPAVTLLPTPEQEVEYRLAYA